MPSKRPEKTGFGRESPACVLSFAESPGYPGVLSPFLRRNVMASLIAKLRTPNDCTLHASVLVRSCKSLALHNV